MKKILVVVSLFLVLLFPNSAFSLDNAQDQRNTAAYEQAKRDYRVYLDQLRTLNQQYKDVTRQVAQIIKEEGLPTWDAGDQKIDLGNSSTEIEAGAFGVVDIEETSDHLMLKMDLPGVQKDKIQLNIRDNKFLDVKAEREERKVQSGEQNGGTFYRSERQHGVFERSIELPVFVNDTGTKAKYENGVLHVAMKKVPVSKKDVKIKVE